MPAARAAALLGRALGPVGVVAQFAGEANVDRGGEEHCHQRGFRPAHDADAAPVEVLRRLILQAAEEPSTRARRPIDAHHAGELYG